MIYLHKYSDRMILVIDYVYTEVYYTSGWGISHMPLTEFESEYEFIGRL